MSIRSLKFNITADTDTPVLRRLWAGMQFEDNATEVCFLPDTQLLTQLSADAVFRIDLNSAAGYNPSEDLTPDESGYIKRSLPFSVTRYGGEAEAVFVITDKGCEILSYPVTLFFTAVRRDALCSKEIHQSLSGIEQSVRRLSEAASQSEENSLQYALRAESAGEQTELARRSLEEDTEFVFMGGGSETTSDTVLITDGELSAGSTNPVQNKAVTVKLRELEDAYEADRVLTEQISNKVTFVDEGSSDEQYPSAKCLFDRTCDFVVDYGCIGIWSYRKWNSGFAECWGKYTGTVALGSGWADGFYIAQSGCDAVEYPITFVERPSETVCISSDTYAAVCCTASGGGNTATYTGQYLPVVPAGGEETAEFTFDYHVRGLWKEYGGSVG